MLQFDSDNILSSTRDFLANGFTVIDLLNHNLTDPDVIKELLQKNNIPPSSKLPGLIVQAYLLLARKFHLEVFLPINNTVITERAILQPFPVVPKADDDVFHVDNFDANAENTPPATQKGPDFDAEEPAAKKAKVILDCPMCDETFESNIYRSVHLENNHLDRKWRCKYCSVEHTSFTKLTRHIYKKHKTFECKECGETFPTFQSHYNHKMKKHTEKNAECQYCGKKFYQQALKLHIENVHETGEFPCDQCDKVLASKHYLKTHKIQQHPIVKKEKKFKCDFCDLKFISAAPLNYHVKYSHTFEPVNCEICGKTYDNQAKLRCHVENVHNEENKRKQAEKYANKPKQRWQCEICDTVLCGKEINQLKRVHMETHEPPKYACEICGKLFRQRDNYLGHLNMHKGINDFTCEKCNKASKSFSFRNFILCSVISVKECFVSTLQKVGCSSKRSSYSDLKLHQHLFYGEVLTSFSALPFRNQLSNFTI